MEDHKAKVTLYAASVVPLRDEKKYRLAYQRVSLERRQKTDKYRLYNDRCLSVAAELLLRHGLRDLNRDNDSICIRTNDFGKPFLADSDIYFNISHSGDWAICAISNAEVGCDIEKIGPADMQLAERFFCSEEYSDIAGQKTENSRVLMFYRYWTLKESFIKASGSGMQIPLNSFCIEPGDECVSVRQSSDPRRYYFAEFDAIPGYCCALCSVGVSAKAELKLVDLL